MTGTAPSFAQQKMVAIALLVAMAVYAVAVAIVLQSNDGKGLASAPTDALDQVAMLAGICLAISAMAIWRVLQTLAANTPPPGRAMARFRATLIPLAVLEGGSLLGITTWLLNGRAIPALVTALVLFALAVVVVPFSDPDA